MSNNSNQQNVVTALNVAGASPGMLAYWDKNLICRYANCAYRDWFGLAPEDMIDKMSLKTLLGPLYKKNLPYITGALNGETQIFERLIPFPSGLTKITRATYTPDIADGVTRGFYVQVVDISPLNNPDNDEFRDAARQLQSDHLLDDVVQTIKSCIFTEFPGIFALSKKHFVSESKLKRDFKEKFKTSIFSFYRDLQMEWAYQYITEKKGSKKQMALALNFSNPSNFLSCYNNYVKKKLAAKQIAEMKQQNEDQYKTFVTQVPFEIAMFDTHLNYLAASKMWLENYKMEGKDYIGKNLYELSPGSEEKFSKIVEACLNGGIDQNGEAPVKRQNRPFGWMRWNIRCWYTLNQQIGGLIMMTEDLTDLKQKVAENRQLSKILKKTNNIARIGAWSRNFKTNTGYYDTILKQMLEVPEDYVPDFEAGLRFYKEGYTRLLIEKSIKTALETGESFDVEAEIITAKGNQKKVRVIGFPEFINGVCENISGIFQEIPAI